MSNEQTNPLHATDRNIIDSLITKEKPEDLDFINLARLINRYTGSVSYTHLTLPTNA